MRNKIKNIPLEIKTYHIFFVLALISGFYFAEHMQTLYPAYSQEVMVLWFMTGVGFAGFLAFSKNESFFFLFLTLGFSVFLFIAGLNPEYKKEIMSIWILGASLFVAFIIRKKYMDSK